MLESNVRFGSKADICSAKRHVRFTPKADMCGATSHVRFVPIPDIARSAKAKEAANWGPSKKRKARVAGTGLSMITLRA